MPLRHFIAITVLVISITGSDGSIQGRLAGGLVGALLVLCLAAVAARYVPETIGNW